MNWINEIIVEAKQRSVFADHDPYGSRAKWLREKLQEAHTKGTQEALAKVEEWVKENTIRDFELRVYNIDADDLLHHLQQLKDETR